MYDDCANFKARQDVDQFNNMLFEAAQVTMVRPFDSDTSYQAWAAYIKKINDVLQCLSDAEDMLNELISSCQGVEGKTQFNII